MASKGEITEGQKIAEYRDLWESVVIAGIAHKLKNGEPLTEEQFAFHEKESS